MPLYEILIPTVHPDNTEILPVYRDVWIEKITEIAGGLTVLSDAKGTWTTPDGKMCFENMIPVLINCTPEQINKIIDFTLAYYQQEAVFAFKMTDDVIIRYAPRKVVEFKHERA